MGDSGNRQARPAVHLSSPIERLQGIGPIMSSRLREMGIGRVEDLLFHLPARYQDRRKIWRVRDLRPGMEAAVQGEIIQISRNPGRREQWLAILREDSGTLPVRLFHLAPGVRQQWIPGRRLWCFGEIRVFRGGLEMVHPEWHSLEDGDFQVPEFLTPFYPSRDGIHQNQWRRWIARALQLLPELEDPLQAFLPPPWPSLAQAVLSLHQRNHEPSDVRDPFRERLALEELLAHHLALRRERARTGSVRVLPLSAEGHLWQALQKRLPFRVTMAQQRVIDEIVQDLSRPHPMRRLVQGDVGSGKTLVAVAALLHAMESGAQVAVMAPTEILAGQLARRLQEWLAPLGVSTAILAGNQGRQERQPILEGLRTGTVAAVCGTQALFQEGVEFANLALVIIDEQHRFGVEQRRRLLVKARIPHLLVMTATPIPRTLAMALHADLDVSVIDELPPGRQPVETVVLPDSRREALLERLHRRLAAGHQIYWVCPLIEEQELLQLRAAEASFAELQELFPEYRVGLVHGRQPAEVKAAVMEEFRAGSLHLLVATTVIEVGVDVPNASLMVIEHSERLGLAQLHQLRGRVGRGSVRSTCVLLYHPPLGLRAKERLQVMRESTDGFVIARKDLEMRGPGEFLGVRQSGDRQMRVADSVGDEDLLELLPGLAHSMESGDRGAESVLVRRWLGDSAEYAEIG